jgi:tRNA-(ms[2]io[6]A)-hydroxylase
LLRDHAYCEKKAASAALSLIAKLPGDEVLVRSMTALAHEELRHFRQVHQRICRRGGSLGRPQPDRYVRLLRRRGFQEPGGLGPEVDLLLVNALIEARSCERMRLLVVGLREEGPGRHLDDREDLRRFYGELASAEARHWESFRDLAGRFRPAPEVAARLRGLAALEAEIVRTLPLEPRMH